MSPLPEIAADFTIDDFTPDCSSVEHGATVTLTWKCTVGPDYTIHYGEDEQVAVNDRVDGDGNGSWTSPALTTTTAFLISGASTIAGQPVVHTRSTAVIVATPDMNVGNLSVNGTAALMGTVQTIEPADKYTAGTDGFLHGYVKTTDDTCPAFLSVTITPPGQGSPATISVTSNSAAGGVSNQDGRILAPVPGGSTVHISVQCDAEHSQQLLWVPLGAGTLS
ncbi:hypothetical protein [Kitasatospora sp. NPDC094016]|uniref:hypothetical protein n=1 Tax=Kitasatospora sp. NPDC094016 TaxID=3154986 RepID=UPI00331F9912